MGSNAGHYTRLYAIKFLVELARDSAELRIRLDPAIDAAETGRMAAELLRDSLLILGVPRDEVAEAARFSLHELAALVRLHGEPSVVSFE